MASSESHNTRLSGMKQDLVDFKNDFNSSLSCLKNSIDHKFSNINSWLDQIEGNTQKIITDVVNESIISIKDSIIDALNPIHHGAVGGGGGGGKKAPNTSFSPVTSTNIGIDP